MRLETPESLGVSSIPTIIKLSKKNECACRFQKCSKLRHNTTTPVNASFSPGNHEKIKKNPSHYVLRKQISLPKYSKYNGSDVNQTLMVICFRVSASSMWKPNTSRNKSFKNGYCPLLIIHLTLLAMSTALAFLPIAGSVAALLKVESLRTSCRYDVSKVP